MHECPECDSVCGCDDDDQWHQYDPERGCRHDCIAALIDQHVDYDDDEEGEDDGNE